MITQQQIAEAIQAELREWPESPREINSGNCDSFAMAFVLRLGGYKDGLQDNATPDPSDYAGHCWIEYEGRCYDAECPQGVDTWKELPIFSFN